MSLVKNPSTGNWEADFRSKAVGRLHVSLRTKRKSDAMDRHAALAALVREHPTALIEDLRSGRITVEAIARVYSENKPFATLSASTQWPTLGEAREQLAEYMRGRDDLAQGTREERERAQDQRMERRPIPDPLWRALYVAYSPRTEGRATRAAAAASAPQPGRVGNHPRAPGDDGARAIQGRGATADRIHARPVPLFRGLGTFRGASPGRDANAPPCPARHRSRERNHHGAASGRLAPEVA